VESACGLVPGWFDASRPALTQGIGRDGRAFKLPMARQVYFSKVTDDDVNAIVTWVRSIARKHRLIAMAIRQRRASAPCIVRAVGCA
jgi:hypothetical protein